MLVEVREWPTAPSFMFLLTIYFLKKLYNIVRIGEMYVQMLSDIAFEFCAFDPMVT